jgi:anaerobic magnesium-protoporphyrin IX monomethyl ester cyclase
MIDCLIIGFNDLDFEEYVETVCSQGENSAAYRSLNLSFVKHEGKPYRSIDLLNLYYARSMNGQHWPFNNADFLWPVITYLGSYLHRRGFTFDYVNLFHLEKEKLREKLQQGDVRTVAITTTLYVSVEPVLEVVDFIRRFNQAAQIIVGGPYIHNQVQMLDDDALQSLFKYIAADIYVIGPEGEAALVDVLTSLRNGSGLSQCNNIAFRDGSRFVRTPSAPEVNSLAENMVDYSLFDRDVFGEFVTLRTAKSCPFSCAFCGFPQRAGKYSYLGVELVEKELNAIRDIGTVTTLTFIDDTFNVPKMRFKEIMRMMIRNRYKFRWNSFLRSDHVDEEALDLMAEAGCEGVFLGVESGSNSLLKNMDKRSRREDYLRVIPLLRERGIGTHASLIIGFPGETDETVRESVSLIEEARPEFFRAQLWYADPTTPIWQRRQEFGIQGSSFNWRHDTMDAATAMDHIERSFLGVEHSIWLPDWGFDQWSIFYLQRRGMSLDKVKAFVKCFNAAVKEKLVFPRRSETSPELLACLEMACCSDNSPPLEVAPPDAFSAARYKADEEYWNREFNHASNSGSLVALRDGGEGAQQGWDCVHSRLTTDCEDFAVNWAVDVERHLLAAYAVLLARWAGREEIALVAQLNHGSGGVVPLRIPTPWKSSFRDIVQEVGAQTARAEKHRMYAFHLVSNNVRLMETGLRCPIFCAGWYFGGSAVGPPSLLEALSDYPAVAGNLVLVLEAMQSGDDLQLQFLYEKSAFRVETAEQASNYLTVILEAVSRQPDMAIGDIANTSREKWQDQETEEEFRF